MDPSPELRELNKKVTDAIYRAEHLPPGPEAQVAFREVSEIEEEIARRTAPDSLQGSIARRGAITAALSGGDWLRALRLAEAYLAEPLPAELARELARELVALRDEANDLGKAEVPEIKQVPLARVPFPVACRCWNIAGLHDVTELGPETDATWPELSLSSNRCPLGHHPRCEFYVDSPLPPQLIGSQDELMLALAKLAHAYHELMCAAKPVENRRGFTTMLRFEILRQGSDTIHGILWPCGRASTICDGEVLTWESAEEARRGWSEGDRGEPLSAVLQFIDDGAVLDSSRVRVHRYSDGHVLIGDDQENIVVSTGSALKIRALLGEIFPLSMGNP